MDHPAANILSAADRQGMEIYTFLQLPERILSGALKFEGCSRVDVVDENILLAKLIERKWMLWINPRIMALNQKHGYTGYDEIPLKQQTNLTDKEKIFIRENWNTDFFEITV